MGLPAMSLYRTLAVDASEGPKRNVGSAVASIGVATLMRGVPRLSSAARAVLVFLVVVSYAAWAAPAAARSHESAGAGPASHVVLRSHFRPIRAEVGKVFASGDYLLSTVANGFYPHGFAPIVINDRLDATTALDPSCDADALGPPWVLMSCPQSSDPYGPYDLELYLLADGTSQTVTLSPGMPYCSLPPLDLQVDCSADAVGAYWIEWVGSSYHHLPTEVYFQNIETRALRGDPTNATTFADLNSPALAHTTCPGVQLMPDPDPVFGMGWGSLTPVGQFALAIGNHDDAFLERCGTHMRRLLTTGPIGYRSAPVSNAGAIVWQTARSQLNGLLLPGLQTFTIPLPSAVVASQTEYGQGFALALSSSALYMHEFGGKLWQAASPTALPRNMIGPGVTQSGRTLTCVQGRWGDTVSLSYQWRVNRMTEEDAKPGLVLGKGRKRRTVSCSVTASNAVGTTTASSAQLHVR
jgi:hypothetical protein